MLSNISTDFIVIDALDEFKEDENEQERQAFFEVLQEIKSAAVGEYKIFITSRPEPYIKRELTELGVTPVGTKQDLVDEDIRSHVRTSLQKDARLKKWPQPVKQEMRIH